MWSFRYASTVAVPADPVDAGAEVGRARRDQLDVRVGPLHQLGGFQRELAVIFGACGGPSARDRPSHCPGPSTSPSTACSRPFCLRSFVMAVSSAELQYSTHCCASVPRAGAEIRADVRLVPERLGVIQKFVRAEAVALHRAPGHFEARRALVARADAVHPVVVRREVAARPAQQRDIQILHGLQHIFAVAVGIRERRALFEDAAFDAAAQVFGEIAVDLRIDVADPAFGIDLDAGLQSLRLRAQRERNGERE